jgi:hypothetical protein
MVKILFFLVNIIFISSFRKNKEEPKNIPSTDIYIDDKKVLILDIQYEEKEKYYITALGIGTPTTYFPVQIDTAIGKTWVPSLDCDNCLSLFKYNSSNSNTSKTSLSNEKLFDMNGNIEGRITYDNINLGNTNLKNFKFIQVLKIFSNFSDYEDGKIGLGYCNDCSFDLVSHLRNEGIINKKMFTIKEINSTNGEIIFGDIPKEIKLKNFPIFNISKIPNKDDYEEIFQEAWIIKLGFIIIGTNYTNRSNEKVFKDAIEIDSYVSFDISSEYIDAPYSQLRNFKNYLFDEYLNDICILIEKNNITTFICDNYKYKNNPKKNIVNKLGISFLFDGYSYDIPISDLFNDINTTSSEFVIRFKHFSQNTWIIGYPFMHLFTMVFDKENDLIGIIGNSYNMTNIYKNYQYYRLLKVLTIIGIICGIILLLIIIFLIYKCIRKNANNSEKISLVENELMPSQQ